MDLRPETDALANPKPCFVFCSDTCCHLTAAHGKMKKEDTTQNSSQLLWTDKQLTLLDFFGVVSLYGL